MRSIREERLYKVIRQVKRTRYKDVKSQRKASHFINQIRSGRDLSSLDSS